MMLWTLIFHLSDSKRSSLFNFRSKFTLCNYRSKNLHYLIYSNFFKLYKLFILYIIFIYILYVIFFIQNEIDISNSKKSLPEKENNSPKH